MAAFSSVQKFDVRVLLYRKIVMSAHDHIDKLSEFNVVDRGWKSVPENWSWPNVLVFVIGGGRGQ